MSALRSQTLWHAIAYGVSAGAPPTASFVRPSQPYVCLGYHRRLDELDLDECRQRGLPVYRRMVGGGPVYLDDGQLFFQITVPAAAVPLRRDRALRLLLEPAVEAFRASGVPARLDENLEIVVGDRKVCGHGAGQIDDAVVVVGNLIERFDHRAAAQALRAPSPPARRVLLELMHRYVAATPADPTTFRDAAVQAYARVLGVGSRPGTLTPSERVSLAELDHRFEDPAWLRGPDRPVPPVWRAKVRAGVWVVAAEHQGSRVVAGVVGDRLEQVEVADVELNGTAPAVERALTGCPIGEAPAVLGAFGEPGQRLAAALAKADTTGL